MPRDLTVSPKALVLAAIVLAGAGCGSSSATCPPDTDCDGAPVSGFAIELMPLRQTLGERQEIAEVSFDIAGRTVVRLGDPVYLDGKVLDGDEQPIDAQVLAMRPSLVPGLSPVFYQTATDNDGRFRLAVSPGSFMVRIIPQGADEAEVPPATERLEIRGDTNRTYILPRPGKLAVIIGRVSTPLGDGVEKARVRAVDRTTGMLQSTVATTDGTGDFVLFIAPEVDVRQPLRVLATSPSPMDPVLSQDVSIYPLEVHDLRMPPLPRPVPVSVSLIGKSPAGGNQPVVGARVDFTADVSLPGKPTVASYHGAAVSTPDGLATAMLVPGAGDTNRVYQVSVAPPANSLFGRKSFPLSVGPNGSGGVFGTIMLDKRPQVIGRLLGPSGKPVRGAVIAPQTLSTETVDAALPNVLTDSNGGFAMRVDPGTYEVEVAPPAAEALARWSFERAIDGDVSLGDLVLPRAAMAEVTVFDARDRPVAGAQVRLWAVRWGPDCFDKAPACALPARLRGDGFTDARGIVKLLLATP